MGAFCDWLDRNEDVLAIEYHKFGTRGNSFILRKEGKWMIDTLLIVIIGAMVIFALGIGFKRNYETLG